MAKLVKLEPINQEAEVITNDNLLSALLGSDLNVMQECGNRGMCATCHIYIKSGMEGLTPVNRREKRTLEVVSSVKPNSRLACQARVVGEGVVVELPNGMYVNAFDDLESLIGRRAEQDILHPLNGKVLVATGKLITRSVITQLQDTNSQAREYLTHTSEA